MVRETILNKMLKPEYIKKRWKEFTTQNLKFLINIKKINDDLKWKKTFFPLYIQEKSNDHNTENAFIIQ